MYVYNARTFDIIENANYEDYIGDTNYIVTDKLLCNPIIDPKTKEVREATREELCELGRLSILDAGEVYQDGTIIKKEPSIDLFKPKWEYPNWVESMSQEEREDYHNKLIDTLKAELLEDGFIYSDKAKTSHQQKCRDKDLSYLGNAIASMTDASIPTMKWYFNNEDMLELSLEDMKGLRANGSIFLSVVFGIEAQMKAEKPTKNISLETFKDKVDAISQVKCWRA